MPAIINAMPGSCQRVIVSPTISQAANTETAGWPTWVTEIVATGTPEDICAVERSFTGEFLDPYLPSLVKKTKKRA